MSLNDMWVQSECDRKQLWSGMGGMGVFCIQKNCCMGALEMSVGEATESRGMICGFRVSVTGSSSGVGSGGGGGGGGGYFVFRKIRNKIVC